MIRAIKPSDAQEVCEIYNYYVANTWVTFEEELVPEEEINRRISEISTEFPWLVSIDNNELTGYAYASFWKNRSAYRYSAESTIYLKKGYTGKGFGINLYKELIVECKKKKIHSLIGGIALPNNASIALHEKLGFKKVAHFQQVGFKLNKWIDVAYWQLLLTTDIA